MTSSIESKVVPFGEAVDTIAEFLESAGYVDTPGGVVPGLRKLVGEIQTAAAEKVDEQIGDFNQAVFKVQESGQQLEALVDQAEAVKDSFVGISEAAGGYLLLSNAAGAMAGKPIGAACYVLDDGANNGFYVVTASGLTRLSTSTLPFFSALFNGWSLSSQEVLGDFAWRWKVKDAEGKNRILAQMSTDAAAGLQFFMPLRLPDGTLPMSVLDAAARATLPFSLSDDASGFALSWFASDPAGKRRRLAGVPASYPAEPATLNVRRARYAEAFAGKLDSAGTYFLGGSFDSQTGEQTLWTRHVKTGIKRAITTSGHAVAPDIVGGRAVWIDEVSQEARYRPLDASDIARRVRPNRTVPIIGDSTGQGLEQQIGALLFAAGRRLYPMSVGSQKTKEIAIRFGVMDQATGTLAYISFPGGSIPASGAVSCAIDYDFIVGAGGAAQVASVRVSVPTLAGGAVEGVLQRTYSAGAAVWTFVRLVAGAEAAVGVAALPLTILAAVLYSSTDVATAAAMTPIDEMREGSPIVRMSRNDVDKVDYSQALVVARIRLVLNRMTPMWGQPTVFGLMQSFGIVPAGQGSDGTGTSILTAAQCAAIFDKEIALNEAIKAEVGAGWIDAMQIHADAGAGRSGTWTYMGTTYRYLTPTVLTDSIHESTASALITANAVMARLTALEF